MKSKMKKNLSSRILILTIVFFILGGFLIQRLFVLQIIRGEDYENNFTMQIKKEKVLNGTRGNIYDVNGYPLAYNKLVYCVTFEDVGSYETLKEKNLKLNGIFYQLIKIIEEHGSEVISDFGIRINNSGNYEFAKTGFNLMRFKADIYGRIYIDDLTEEEKNIDAAAMMEELCSDDYYGILGNYTPQELAQNGLPSKLTMKETLQLATLRSALAANSYQKYMSITIAEDISEEAVAVIMENKDKFLGVDVVEDTIRVYNDAIYFAPIIGYTGPISEEELEELKKEDSSYNRRDIVGKSGLENYFEIELQGKKGSQTFYVDNMGKVLEEENYISPSAGSDIYLTIDHETQIAAYKILEQRIAGILYSMIENTEFYPEGYLEELANPDNIRIPIYDVYYALFKNNVIDISHLSSEDATGFEQGIYQKFAARQAEIFATLKEQLISETPTIYNDLSQEYQVYQTYIADTTLIESGILLADTIDQSDETYKTWQDGTISLREYLTYAISKNWIDVSKVTEENQYLNSDEIYSALADSIAAYLKDDLEFSKYVYRYMIADETLTGTEICLLLFEQEIIEWNEEDYNSLAAGVYMPYDFMRAKIYSLEITPAQLALAPCSGSLVVTDVNTGNVVACATYPSYDNNRLANSIDSDYFISLTNDLSSPFYNRATQEVTAPGSTFKMITAVAGIEEGVINAGESIECKGTFEEVTPNINCWISPGNHGVLTLSEAIEKSCNYYFNTVGYWLGFNGGEESEDGVGIERLMKYAALFGLDDNSGIEIAESDPQMADVAVAPAAMGQSNNAYTTTQLAKYVATIANRGTCYDLTLLDKITDTSGTVLREQTPNIHSQISLSADAWGAIQYGMNQVIHNTASIEGTDAIEWAGKTGTAEESKIRPNHAVFVGYAPYDNPQYAIAVRVTNGYTSANSAAIAGDMVSYLFHLQNEEELLSGVAKEGTTNTVRTD